MIWVVPGVVAVVLALPVVLALRRCSREAAALRRSLGALRELAPAVAELRDDVSALRAGVPPMRGRTRPA